MARYPIDPAVATGLLERWEETGQAVKLDDGARWADRRNLDEVRRLSLALRRSESVAVRPEVFAEFVLHRQYVHPATCGDGPVGLETVLERLLGLAAPAELWESEILPRRIKGYRPDQGQLDALFAGGEWLWRRRTDGDDPERGGVLRIAFIPRDFPGRWAEATLDGNLASTLPEAEAAVLDHLTRRGQASRPTWRDRPGSSRRGPAAPCGPWSAEGW